METILLLISTALLINLPLLAAWLLDRLLGDPVWLPHPVVAFGRSISFFEHRLNKGAGRKLKGAFTAIFLVLAVYFAALFLLRWLADFSAGLLLVLQILALFFCLAGTTLIREVRMVFLALDRSLEEGRAQVSRIVGRDTSSLSAQEVRTAALETLAENLSDGVITPLFWYMLLGIPGILAYKMVNTLDSMIGYRNERYRDFGCFAARLDDVANFIPARLTAFLMILAAVPLNRHRRFLHLPSGGDSSQPGGFFNLLKFVGKYGNQHASPNSGYPEAALAGILNCRFGGPHNYFGREVWKPYIGTNPRPLTTADMHIAVRINRIAEGIMIIILILITTFASFFI